MKIRIKGNSIRYRLTKSEVADFCKKGYYEEQTQFIQHTFIYAIRMRESIKNIEARLTENKIELVISKQLIGEWATDTNVGFQHNIQLQNGEVLLVVVEKDFTCLDNVIEDQSDNYPNPRLQ